MVSEKYGLIQQLCVNMKKINTPKHLGLSDKNEIFMEKIITPKHRDKNKIFRMILMQPVFINVDGINSLPNGMF